MKINFILFLFFAASFASGQTGITWNSGMNVASSSTGNHHPRVVTDRAGNPLVLWGNANRAMFSRWNGTAFTTPVMLNPMTMNVAEAAWMGPDIASHGDTVYVVFKRTPEVSDTCHIYCITSFNGGVTFSAPVQVDDIADSISRFPTVTTDDLGNPIVAFMKFDPPSWTDARWVVARSTDFGSTFSMDVKASGWSAPGSDVCDCCPGAITCSGNTVAMLYRDNNSNIRDSWVGLSSNGGTSFSGGMGVDQQNWMLMMCPSSSPDGVIIGDTLYSAFMNGATGTNLVSWNKSSVSAGTGSAAIPITGTITGLTQQNYPRVAGEGVALGIVWKQVVSGTDQCVIRFTNNIANGLSAAYDTIDSGNVTNADVTIRNGKIFVVWQDDLSGTVKYRDGTYTVFNPPPASVNEVVESPECIIYPNPSSGKFEVRCRESGVRSSSLLSFISVEIYNLLGEKVFSEHTPLSFGEGLGVRSINISQPPGIYILKLQTKVDFFIKKLVVE